MGDIIIQAVIFALLSLIFIVAGLRILTAKSPFIVSKRWQVIFVAAPSMGILIYTAWPKYPEQSWLPTLLVLGGITLIWGINLWQFREGIVIGAAGTALHDALRYALHGLNLPYEESAQSFRLPTLNNELMAGATGIDGIYVLRFKRFGNRPATRQLAVEIKDYFRTAPVRTNRRVSYALVVFGGALLLFGFWMTYERLSLQAKMRATGAAHTEFIKQSDK
jgi:hypothetical protein